jgi:hypothetical protein
MAEKIPSDEQIKRFLSASDDLMKLGITFSQNIDSAFQEFKKELEMMTRTDFVEKAVVEMLSDSFARLERTVKENLESITRIYREGGHWYSLYLGRAMTRSTAVHQVVPEESISSSREAQKPRDGESHLW